MNILEEIQNCPVEWKELGEVVDYEQPTKYIVSSKAYTDSNEIPVLTAGQSFILGYTNEKTGIYQASKTNPVIIFDDFTTSKQWVDFKFKVKSSAMKMLTIKDEFENEVLLRYAWHYLGTITYKPDQHGRQWIGTYSKFLIPELTSELTSRKKQYSFYRDKLLSFEDEVYHVEWKTLDAVSEQTSNISWNKIGDDEKFKYIDLSSVDRVSNKIIETTSITKLTAPSRAQKIVKSNDIILGTTRPTLKRFTKITDNYNDQICSTGFYVFRTNGEVLSNYIYHIFSSSKFYKYLEENQSGTSYPAISDALVKKYKIPVPSLEIQSRIVQVLDNFDTVCHDLNIGLPKEVELRQKQYEYFREKLLTFVAEGEYTESRVE